MVVAVAAVVVVVEVEEEEEEEEERRSGPVEEERTKKWFHTVCGPLQNRVERRVTCMCTFFNCAHRAESRNSHTPLGLIGKAFSIN
jgi:hypothetical protein